MCLLTIIKVLLLTNKVSLNIEYSCYVLLKSQTIITQLSRKIKVGGFLNVSKQTTIFYKKILNA